ncbi:MAG: GGDEF domain-containing protein, partial [Gammaproteobacteria bacterium]|nr:GGDEF domain-containing protein [Gammaproteobacteria bacterium]
TLTLQQTAMYLRRGILKILVDEATPAVDRALYGVLQQMHGRIEQQATNDPGTGFLTRKNFIAQVDRCLPELAEAKRGAIQVQIRLTGIDEVNSELGTEAGDALLAGAAAIIRELTGKYDALFGRVGGPDLGICIRRAALPAVRKTLEDLLDAFSRRGVNWEEQRLELAARCGVAEHRDPKQTAEQLLDAAAAACAEAVSEPEHPICVSGETDSRQRERLELMEAYIPKAIERQRLRLLYRTVRPVVGAADILPTMHVAISAVDRAHKLIASDLFMQAAANSAQALEIDRWGISAVLRWMAANPDEMQRYDSVIIPLSAAALRDDLLTGFVIEELMRSEVPPGRICFAMNDAEVLAHLAGASELARTLHDFGCRFLLDEFGSGQKTYDYVRDLQIDYVAIQTLFVRDAARDPKDLAMVKSINELAHFMGKRTIARQTTDEPAVSLLRDIGVDFIHELADPTVLQGS